MVALAYSDGWAQGVDPARNFDHIPLQFEDLPQDVNTGTAEDDGALIHFDLDLMNSTLTPPPPFSSLPSTLEGGKID